MLRALVLCAAALCLPVHGQPVSCKEEAHCSDGYYCETGAEICRECLSCEDLKREPPLAAITCIKSVAECGSCFKGLVVDPRGNVNAECVPPDTSSLEPTPSYVWLLISIAILLFLGVVVGIIAYLLRYPEIFKTAGSNQSSTVTARITATAPEAPPPYNPLPQTPYFSPAYRDLEPINNEDEQFIKHPPSPRPQDSRESAGNQAARVYEKPIYERELPPRSPESPLPEYTETETMTLPVKDEDTIPSPWTPGGSTSNGDVNANSVVSASGSGGADRAGASTSGGAADAGLPALLAAARSTTLIEPSPAKRLCVRWDSVNNRNRESNSCSDSSQNSYPRSPSPSQGGGPPYSFITQITNVVQINTNK
uniref:TNFR-Cys domain-containing protein n=1 Tax=Heliothis virescens TaxID=7102 RepID=A0A2A4JRE9_HELVI